MSKLNESVEMSGNDFNEMIESMEPKSNNVETKSSRMRKLHNDGLTVGEIAKTMDVSYQHVYNTLKNSKGVTLNVRVRDNSDSKSSKIRELHKDGLTAGQISKRLNIRYQHVYNVLKGQINKVQVEH